MKGLIEFIQRNRIVTPVQLEMRVEKVYNSGTSRYVRVKINGVDVGGLVALATGNKVSKAKGNIGCVIVHGCGMDMLLDLQMKVYRAACKEGYPNMFDRDRYKTF